ncbi:transmembrane protein 187 isoform X2 [Mustelus asterias]
MGLMSAARLGPRAQAFLHVLLLLGACVAALATGLFDGVCTELGYGHYAERPRAGLPRWLAMPCNSLVNLGYMAVGAYWLRRPAERGEPEARAWAYHRAVFAWMALAYGPVQWARLTAQSQRSAALDQWLTLPFFAWVPAWAALLLPRAPTPGRLALASQAASVASYGLALAHCRGFELALAAHVLLAALAGLAAQARLGDPASRLLLAQALASCAGFVGLKLLEWPLSARGLLPQPLSGHFLSKLCDIMQIHLSIRFLERLGRRQGERLSHRQGERLSHRQGERLGRQQGERLSQ